MSKNDKKISVDHGHKVICLVILPSILSLLAPTFAFAWESSYSAQRFQHRKIDGGVLNTRSFIRPSVSPSETQTHNNPSAKSRTSLHIWKPPDDGWRKGYFNFNERGDFDPRKGRRNRIGRGRRRFFDLSSIKDNIKFPKTLNLQTGIVYMNVLFYLYQLITATLSTPQLNLALSRSGYKGHTLTSLQVLERNIMGGSSIIVRGSPNPKLWENANPHLRHMANSMRPILASSSGPFTMDFIFSQTLGKFQPHRFLTAGFLHGSLLHLFFNMRYLSKLPLWLEYGLGRSLYLTTYLISIICGNIAHYITNNVRASACLGASGGICGLNGLMFILYRRMNRPQQSWAVFRNMAFLLFLGLIDSNISNASHIGGFLGGMVVAILCSPNFRKSYVAKRKVWFDDDSDERLRRIMGPDLVETAPLLDLRYLWGGILLFCFYNPKLRAIPFLIVQGLIHPGSLSGMI